MTLAKRISLIVLYVLFFAVIALGSFWIYQVKLATVPLTYPELPLSVLTRELHPGGTLHTYVKRCNVSSHPIDYTIDRVLISTDGQFRVNLQSSTVKMDPGCQRLVVAATPLPADLPPGFYILEGVSTVKGDWRDFRVQWATVPFEVLKAK